jgi:hypothetical protein
MIYEIKNYYTGTVIYSGEGDTLRDVVRQAVASRANLSWANLSWANLSGANLSWANLSWANLSGANLSWANLSWANLSGANLSGAYLSWANLSWANLSGANLSWANLSWANLSWANLSGANLNRAIIGDHKITKWLAQLRRSDGYEFLALLTESGEILIRAGCRTLTLPEYREHVKTYRDAAKEAETTAILDFIEGRAKA